MTRSRRTLRWAPVPWQVGHGSSMIVPVPWQLEQGWEIEKIPWLWASTPRPSQTGQTLGVVPGLAPVVLMVASGALYGAVMASYNGLEGQRAWMVLYGAVKIPLLFLATLALAIPCRE